MAKLPKWAIRKAGGINKKAWALARKGKGKSKAKKTTQKTKAKSNRRTSNMNLNFLGGGFGKALIAGVAVGVIDRVIPIPIAGADYMIAGIVMKEPLLTKLGAITLGRNLAGGVTGFFGGGNGGNTGGGGVW